VSECVGVCIIEYSCVTDVLWMTSWSVGSVGLGAKVGCLKRKCLLTWRPFALPVPLHCTLNATCECAMGDVRWVCRKCYTICTKHVTCQNYTSDLIHFYFSLFTFTILQFSLHVLDRLVHHQENQITRAAPGTFPSFVAISCVAVGANWVTAVTSHSVSTNGHARDSNEWGKGAKGCTCNLILLMMDQPVRNM